MNLVPACKPSSTKSSLMEHQNSKLMEFPHLTKQHKDLMVSLMSTMEDSLESHLQPSCVPSDVQYYQNQSGSSQGTLMIRRGVGSSHIDFILASWIHLEQPTGGALDITNLQGYLKSSTDAPHFQFELVQCSPSYFILFIDLTPRKDLVFHPDYLKTFYEDLQLESHRQELYQVPEIQHYVSSSLYFRKVVSPTGILVSVKCEDTETGRIQDIISDNVSSVAHEILELWIDKCVRRDRDVDEIERVIMEKRDCLIKNKEIEMDLSSSYPTHFGEEVADRVLKVITEVFGV